MGKCHLLQSLYTFSEMDLKEGNAYTKKVQEFAGSDAQVVLICANLEEEYANIQRILDTYVEDCVF